MRKRFLIFALFAFCAILPCAADAVEREALIQNLAESVQRSAPFAALAPLSWSDAYIGQIISRKPHFGAGLSYGMSIADYAPLRALVQDAGGRLGMDTSAAMMPPFYAYIRLGGFFVPFDFGLAASLPLASGGANISRQSLAGDIRFAVLTENEKFPGVSVGLAYAMTRGNLSVNTSAAPNSELDVEWMANGVEIKAQISKPINAWTPYGGFAAGFSWSRAGYKILENGIVMETAGMLPDDYSNGVLFRFFGGASIKLSVFRLDICALLSAPALDYASMLGFRCQL